MDEPREIVADFETGNDGLTRGSAPRARRRLQPAWEPTE
jgi:hypothetical protein